MPKAPISPDITGRVTSLPVKFSKAFSTASERKVPPWTTMCSPRSSVFLILITFCMAFLITEYARPAAMSAGSAPSFWACFTFEFMKTVQREPRSTGLFALRASSANWAGERPMLFEKVSRKEPQPELQASLSNIELITPS